MIPLDLENLDSAEQLQLIADSKMADLRHIRNLRLAETDWTQNSDVDSDTRVSWQAYRQALRDMTINNNDLDGAVWPDEPV